MPHLNPISKLRGDHFGVSVKKIGNRFGVRIILEAIWDKFGGGTDFMLLRNSAEKSEHIKLCKSTQIARKRSWKTEKKRCQCFS